MALNVPQPLVQSCHHRRHTGLNYREGGGGGGGGEVREGEGRWKMRETKGENEGKVTKGKFCCNLE